FAPSGCLRRRLPTLHHRPQRFRCDEPVALQHQGPHLLPVANALDPHAHPAVGPDVRGSVEPRILDHRVGMLALELESDVRDPAVISESGEDLPPHPEVRLPPGHRLGRLGQPETDPTHLVQRARAHRSSSLIVQRHAASSRTPPPVDRTRTATRPPAPSDRAPPRARRNRTLGGRRPGPRRRLRVVSRRRGCHRPRGTVPGGARGACASHTVPLTRRRGGVTESWDPCSRCSWLHSWRPPLPRSWTWSSSAAGWWTARAAPGSAPTWASRAIASSGWATCETCPRSCGSTRATTSSRPASSTCSARAS